MESAIRASQLDERIEGRFRRRSALILWDQVRWEECLQRLQEAEAIARQYNNKVELGLALERAADYWIKRGDIQKGKELAYEALKAGEESGDLQVKVLAAYRLSMAESAEGDLETSLEWLDKGEVWARELGWSRALAWYLWRRGANLLEAGRPAEAEPYLLQAMETVTWDEPRFFAYAKYRLAQVYQRTGRPDLARPTAEEARDLVERIGLGALREDVEALLRELEVA